MSSILSAYSICLLITMRLYSLSCMFSWSWHSLVWNRLASTSLLVMTPLEFSSLDSLNSLTKRDRDTLLLMISMDRPRSNLLTSMINCSHCAFGLLKSQFPIIPEYFL